MDHPPVALGLRIDVDGDELVGAVAHSLDAEGPHIDEVFLALDQLRDIGGVASLVGAYRGAERHAGHGKRCNCEKKAFVVHGFLLRNKVTPGRLKTNRLRQRRHCADHSFGLGALVALSDEELDMRSWLSACQRILHLGAPWRMRPVSRHWP
jgi:hypothetical protein